MPSAFAGNSAIVERVITFNLNGPCDATHGALPTTGKTPVADQWSQGLLGRSSNV